MLPLLHVKVEVKDFLNNEGRAVKSRPSFPCLFSSGDLTAEAPKKAKPATL